MPPSAQVGSTYRMRPGSVTSYAGSPPGRGATMSSGAGRSVMEKGSSAALAFSTSCSSPCAKGGGGHINVKMLFSLHQCARLTQLHAAKGQERQLQAGPSYLEPALLLPQPQLPLHMHNRRQSRHVILLPQQNNTARSPASQPAMQHTPGALLHTHMWYLGPTPSCPHQCNGPSIPVPPHRTCCGVRGRACGALASGVG